MIEPNRGGSARQTSSASTVIVEDTLQSTRLLFTQMSTYYSYDT